MEMKTFSKIINGSKQFSFEGSVLTIQHYYSGECVKLDLSAIDSDMLEKLIFVDETEEED
ncbi:MAG: hypothetical protein RR162_00415 [Oscillospiraceae bacterium]